MIKFEKIPKDCAVSILSKDLEYEVQGYIVACSETELILACINKYGENNGFVSLKTEGVYRVDYNPATPKRCELLSHIKNQVHETIPFPNEQDALRLDLLHWAYQWGKIVTFCFSGDYDLFGYIEDIDGCRIRIIDQCDCEPEAAEGYACIDPEKATAVWVDEKRARDSELVYRDREQKEVFDIIVK